MNELTVAQRLERRRLDEVHACVAPACGARAQTAFAAAERGRFAGREWNAGDMIDLCAPHANDVFSAGGKTREQLPEWLRVDAKPDPYELLLGGLGD